MDNVKVDIGDEEDPTICYMTKTMKTEAIWKAQNPLLHSVPIFILQLGLTLLITRFLLFIFKPLRQPPFISQLIVGILLYQGAMLGSSEAFSTLFGGDSLEVLETAGNFGLVFHVFLVGLEMDVTSIVTAGKRAFSIAIAGILLPLGIGVASFYWLNNTKRDSQNAGGAVLWGLSVSVTGVHTVAGVLTSLKILHTDVGKLGMSSAVVSEIVVWGILALAVPVANSVEGAAWATVATAGFVLASVFAVRPGIRWMLRMYPEGDRLSEGQMLVIVVGVVGSALVTEVGGNNSIVGAFVFGLVFPTGDRVTEIMEQMEDLMTGILMPLYFVTCGVRINADSMVLSSDTGSFQKVTGSVACLFAGKILSTLFVFVSYDKPAHEGLALGLILNAKDIMSLIILNIARDTRRISDQMYGAMVFAILFMTGVVVPLLNLAYHPRTRFLRYKNRSIEKSQTRGELRILACVHQTRHVPGIISLIEATNPNRRSPINLCAVHLVELSGRASTMHIIQHHQISGPGPGPGPGPRSTPVNPKSTQAQSEHIVAAFEDLHRRNHAVSVQSLTVMSPYASMDEDVCNLVGDRRVSLAILPFHKQQAPNGQMDDEGNAAIRRLNQNVLENVSCSVAIFVDRGFGALTYPHRRICMLYFCGPDDREALSYSWRLSGHPAAMLSVIRFLPSQNVANIENLEEISGEFGGILVAISEYEKQKSLDDEFLENFRRKTSHDDSISYTEKLLNNEEETVGAIRGIGHHYDLYVVGGGRKVLSPLTAGLNEWSDCRELGAVGDILVSSDFASAASVLVIQQSGVAMMAEPGPLAGAAHDEEEEEKEEEEEDMEAFGHSGHGFDPLVSGRERERGGEHHGWNNA